MAYQKFLKGCRKHGYKSVGGNDYVVYGNKGITKIQRFKTPMARNPEH